MGLNPAQIVLMLFRHTMYFHIDYIIVYIALHLFVSFFLLSFVSIVFVWLSDNNIRSSISDFVSRKICLVSVKSLVLMSIGLFMRLDAVVFSLYCFIVDGFFIVVVVCQINVLNAEKKVGGWRKGTSICMDWSWWFGLLSLFLASIRKKCYCSSRTGI